MRQLSNRSFGIYLILVTISLPFWALGFISDIFLLPGLPLSALMFICPALATAIYFLIRNEAGAIKNVFASFFTDFNRQNALKFLAAFLIMPFVLLAAFVVDAQRGRIGAIQPINLASAPVLLIIFLVSAVGEEFFWTGIMLKPRIGQERYRSAGWIALAYSAWHVLPFFQTGHDLGWVLGQVLFSFTFRVLIVEAYCLAGGLPFIPILMHAAYNLAWQIYPNQGSYYNPWLAAFGTCLMIIASDLFLRQQNRPAERTG